ncbi:MAG: HEAT repeat domain-containing protein, partial [Candidatus Aminicenantes bacterium]|nr:HEAT repeat domain-containing protein [Candidatus Aminicenantes bacterium]
VRQGLSGSLTKQTSPLVQVALIDLIVSIKEQRAIDALRALIQNEKLDPLVKQRAEQGLERLL